MTLFRIFNDMRKTINSQNRIIEFVILPNSVIVVPKHMNIVPIINYLIQDACGASANAASKCLGTKCLGQFILFLKRVFYLAKPQVVKKTRASNRSKKNSSALNY
jgi:hypothetical protein